MYPDLITRYNLSSRLEETLAEEEVTGKGAKMKNVDKQTWTKSQQERQKTFAQRRDEAILRARKNLLAADRETS
jgi:hypothetical protein